MSRRWVALGASALALMGAPPGPAGAQIDPSGAWRTWRTPHFRVHAQTHNAALAEEAAREAERAYALLARELVPPRGVMDLTLYDNVDFSNGFTTVFPSSRIAIYLTPPAGDPILAPYDRWLRLVITHELTHAFHLDRTRGLWRVAQRIFGRLPGSFPNAYQPSWVAEGLATYYESRLTTAGRLRAGLHDQLLASAALAGDWPRPGDATLLSPRWPAGFRPYAWGSHFFQWEADARGDSVVPRFVERTSKNLWPLLGLPFPGVTPAMRGAGGVGVDSAWRALRSRWEGRARRGTPGTVLVRGLRAEPRPRLSPDGRRLAYVEATGRRDPRLVVRETASFRIVATHRVNAEVTPWWRGDTLYLGQLEFSTPVEIRSALYRWIPGSSWQRLGGSERLARPFSAGAEGLWAVDLASGSSAVVGFDRAGRHPVSLPEADGWGFLAGSPDGAWMAGARHRGGQWDIVAWPTGEPARAVAVTDDPALDEDPVWTPSGAELVFASERAGLPQIFGYRLLDGALVQLTDEPTGARQPAPSPDGWLYYATILWDGWALVRTRWSEQPAGSPVRPGAQAPDTILSFPIEAGSYRPWPALAPHFWLPTWHDAGSAGRFGGAATFGLDPVGRTWYLAALGLALPSGRLEASAYLAHQRWKAMGLHGAFTQTWDGFSALQQLDSGDTVTVTFGQRDETVQVGATAGWRRWRSAFSLGLDGEFERTAYTIDRSRIPLRLRQDRFDYLGGVVSVAGQYLSVPALAISPENGLAAGLLYRRRWETTGAHDWEEWRAVGASYLALPLPGFAHWVVAARGAVGWRGGQPPEGYDVGGESGELLELVPGYAIGPGRRAFPLRGYPARSTRFTRVFTGAVELRVPLVLLGRALWKLPVGLDRVSVTAFGEAGGGWQAGQPARPFALGDLGGELVLDAGVPQDLPRRVRVGVGVPLAAGLGAASGQARWYVAFGTAF